MVNGDIPIVGNWDGRGGDDVGVVRGNNFHPRDRDLSGVVTTHENGTRSATASQRVTFPSLVTGTTMAATSLAWSVASRGGRTGGCTRSTVALGLRKRHDPERR